jgi:hypothetical protein
LGIWRIPGRRHVREGSRCSRCQQALRQEGIGIHRLKGKKREQESESRTLRRRAKTARKLTRLDVSLEVKALVSSSSDGLAASGSSCRREQNAKVNHECKGKKVGCEEGRNERIAQAVCWKGQAPKDRACISDRRFRWEAEAATHRELVPSMLTIAVKGDQKGDRVRGLDRGEDEKKDEKV